MRRWRTVLAVAIATLWVAVGSHCLLEALAGFTFFACEQHAEAAGAAHSDRDCGDDGCWAIESGAYQAQKPVNAPGRPLLLDITTLLTSVEVCPAEARTAPPGISASPPLPAALWKFAQRAALLPRAPTFVS